MRCYLFDHEGRILSVGGSELIKQWNEARDLKIWCDQTSPDLHSEEKLLEGTYQVSKDLIEDAQTRRRPSKYELMDEGYFLLLKGLDAVSDSMNFSTIQIAFIRGKNFLYTRHNGQSVSIDRNWEEIAHNGGKTLDEILLNIALEINNRYLHVLFKLEERLEEIEEEVLHGGEDEMLEELARYRTDIKKMRRFLDYHVQTFQIFVEQSPSDLQDDEEMLPHVYHANQRSFSLASLFNEQITDLMDSSMSLSSHRLNKVMKVLTIITVIFVPLSFLAGIYGMNFEYIPELKSRNGYFVLLAVMTSIVSISLYVFRRIRWL